jgi:NADH dehydrogenase (ubiquinone) 1 beta subcomplex subunit 11
MMAALSRISCIQGLRKGLALIISKEMPICRKITTSSIKKTNAVKETPAKRTWRSFGFSKTDEALDRHSLHHIMFVAITIVFMLGGTILAYLPDVNGRDWAQREAYLQLRYKEEHGLPPIDHNLIDPSKIILPTDEELGDTEIII